MGLLDWFRKSGPEPVGGYGQLVELFSGAAARSGVAVNARTALECSAVLACVRVIANGLAQVPFKLYRAEGRNRNPAVGHGLYELMDMAPNEFQTAFEFRHMLALHLCLTGNAYIWLNRVGGRIVEMLPYPPGLRVHRARRLGADLPDHHAGQAVHHGPAQGHVACPLAVVGRRFRARRGGAGPGSHRAVPRAGNSRGILVPQRRQAIRHPVHGSKP